MKRHHGIIVSAIVLYFVALAVAWIVSTNNALDRTRKLIGRSEGDFVGVIGGSVDSVLLHSVRTILNQFGEDKLWQATSSDLKACCDRFCIDEINFVRTNGVITISSEPDLEGVWLGDNPLSGAFLCLLNGTKFFSQPFRAGAHNSNVYRKYYGMSLDDGSGFIQVGMDFNRIVVSMPCLNRKELRAWAFGRLGHFDLYDENGDGVCDYYNGPLEDGEILKTEYEGRTIFIRSFMCCEHRYVAVLPDREYYDARNVNFSIFASALAFVIAFLAYFVYAQARGAERERLHQAEVDAARARDLDMAKQIQLSVLPSVSRYRKTVFTASFAAESIPAKEVGGDFYDFYFIDLSHLAFIVADVAGKGISAAMFMMRVRSEIFDALCAQRDLVTAVAAANAHICENNDAEMFVTAWIGVLDVHSGEMEYVNAGHNRPFIRRANGQVEKVMPRGGLILGMFPEAKYRSDHLILNPSDVLFLYTDGITEAMNREQKAYGETLLRNYLERCSTIPDEIISGVHNSVRRFVDGAEQSDDITALALVWHGAPVRYTKTFAAYESSLGKAMAWLTASIALKGKKAKARLLNAADEMMTNIVYYSGAQDFTLIVENGPGRTRLTFSDRGVAYNPLLHVDPDTHAPLSDRPEGGLGILMTKRLVDVTHYTYEDACNYLTLVKLDD